MRPGRHTGALETFGPVSVENQVCGTRVPGMKGGVPETPPIPSLEHYYRVSSRRCQRGFIFSR